MVGSGDAESIEPVHCGIGRRLWLAQLAPGLGRGVLVHVLVLPCAQGVDELLRQRELHWRYRGWRLCCDQRVDAKEASIDERHQGCTTG